MWDAKYLHDRETGREGNRIEEAQWVLEKLTDRQTDRYRQAHRNCSVTFWPDFYLLTPTYPCVPTYIKYAYALTPTGE